MYSTKDRLTVLPDGHGQVTGYFSHTQGDQVCVFDESDNFDDDADSPSPVWCGPSASAISLT